MSEQTTEQRKVKRPEQMNRWELVEAIRNRGWELEIDETVSEQMMVNFLNDTSKKAVA